MATGCFSFSRFFFWHLDGGFSAPGIPTCIPPKCVHAQSKLTYHKNCVYIKHTLYSNYWPTILLNGQKANSNWLESAHINVSSNITGVYYSITALNMQIHTGIKKEKKKWKSDSSTSPHAPTPFPAIFITGEGVTKKKQTWYAVSERLARELCQSGVGVGVTNR